MVKTHENTMGTLVNSVKPMAHNHSSFYQLTILTHWIKQKPNQKSQSHKAHVLGQVSQPQVHTARLHPSSRLACSLELQTEVNVSGVSRPPSAADQLSPRPVVRLTRLQSQPARHKPCSRCLGARSGPRGDGRPSSHVALWSLFGTSKRDRAGRGSGRLVLN